jgi:heptosyltransferase I
MQTRLDRIAIVMMTAVGDAVHVLPVITALKRHAPHCKITWVMQPGPALLVRGHDAIDEIVLFEKSKGLGAYLDLRRAMLGRDFDVLIALQVYLKAGLVTALIDSPVKLGFDRARARDLNWLFTTDRIPPHPQQHVQDQYLEFLTYLGVQPEPLAWRLGPWPDERERQREFFERFDRPVAALVIGSSKPQKDWLPGRWAALCDALWADYGLEPVLVGGNSERELATAEEIRSMASRPPVSALGSGLRPLVGILDGSALAISLDTGPLHMSVALNRPVISLMGYSNPKRVGPYRRFQDLIVDAYGEPGEDYPITLEHRTGRMTRIQVRDVLDRMEIWKSRYSADFPAIHTRSSSSETGSAEI